MAIAQPGGGAAIRWEARYKLELIEVKARDETGSDWFGSDDIVILAALDSIIGHGSYGVRIHEGLDDMDSDDDPAQIRSGNRCLLLAVDDVKDGVWGCAEQGHTLPVSLNLTVLEHDGVGRTIWEALTGEGIGFCGSLGVVGDLSIGCDQGGADEYNAVGRVRKVYTATDLAGLGVGQSRTDSLIADWCSEILTIEGGICGSSSWWHRWNGRYRMSVRVTRMKNVLVGVEPATDPFVPSAIMVAAPVE
jgi:hypothetical protein